MKRLATSLERALSLAASGPSCARGDLLLTAFFWGFFRFEYVGSSLK